MTATCVADTTDIRHAHRPAVQLTYWHSKSASRVELVCIIKVAEGSSTSIACLLIQSTEEKENVGSDPMW